jgi:hypothetical protein
VATLGEKLVATLEFRDTELPDETPASRKFHVLTIITSDKTVTDTADAPSLAVETISTDRIGLVKKMSVRTNAPLSHYAYGHESGN